MDIVNSHRESFAGYEYFGVRSDTERAVFRVWAPCAVRAFVTGDFCNWDRGLEMCRIEGGVWQCEIPRKLIFDGCKYKYRLITGDGRELFRIDPYAVRNEESGGFASVICDTDSYSWNDFTWLEYRKDYKKRIHSKPLNIYRLFADLWRAGEGGALLTYKQLANELAPYVKQLGYTHVQLAPTPLGADGSVCGYDTSSYFAPHFYGENPRDLMAFVDSMHEAGIGVIFELPVADVPVDLCRFDGQALYERGVGKTPECLNVALDEVRSYIGDACAFWLDKYHVDGLCIDGAQSMAEDDEYAEAVNEFFVYLANGLKDRFEYAILSLTGDVHGNVSTGFDLVWNTEFYRNVADHLSQSLGLRGQILPLGYHVVKEIPFVPADEWQRFALTRVMLGYLMTAPGKKLVQMGIEIGQTETDRGLKWSLLDDLSNARLQQYSAELGQLYLSSPELWQRDGEKSGCEWIEVQNRGQSIFSFCRRDADGNEMMIVANFAPIVYQDFRIGVCFSGEYKEIFNSDEERFGGSGVANQGVLKSEDVVCDACDHSLIIRIPPMAITVLKRIG